MKLRLGFVTNSSSTSFVIMIKKESYEKAFKEADEFTQQVLNKLGYNSDKAFGIDVVKLTGVEGNYSTLGNIRITPVPEKYTNGYYGGPAKNAFEEFLGKIPKDEIIQTYVDC